MKRRRGDDASNVTKINVAGAILQLGRITLMQPQKYGSRCNPEAVLYPSASRLPIEAEILQALVQLPQPFGVIGNGLTSVGQRTLGLVAVAQHDIGPDQP